MYVSEAEMDRSNLCQGDILSDIQYVGALNYRNILHIQNSEKKATAWQVQNPPQFLDVMVLSHSCELAKENGVKLTSIILAPIRDVHKATRPDRVGELINSNLIGKADPSASYLKYFYVEPDKRLPYSEGAVVDFSKSFSIRKNSYDYLLEKKVVQLEQDFADQMALKLALYFYRSELKTG